MFAYVNLELNGIQFVNWRRWSWKRIDCERGWTVFFVSPLFLWNKNDKCMTFKVCVLRRIDFVLLSYLYSPRQIEFIYFPSNHSSEQQTNNAWELVRRRRRKVNHTPAKVYFKKKRKQFLFFFFCIYFGDIGFELLPL